MSKKSTPLKKSYIFPISHSLCIALFIGIITCLATDCMGQKKGYNYDRLTYETPGVLMASDVLPPELKWGKNYSVRGVTETTTDTGTFGFTHRFEITSIYGNFEAFCIDMVRIRAHEINVIAVLQDIKKTRKFSKAVKKAKKSLYKKAVDFILDPVDTLTGVPKGGWRFITQSGEMVKGGPEGREGGPANALADFFKLKCRFAYKLGVDVYSTNKVLQKELNSVSLAGFASGEGISLIKKPLRGTEGMVIERTHFLDKMDKILLDNAPDDLQRINQEKLKQMGVKEPVIKEFLNHPNYSPRHKTIVVHALAEMDVAQNRDRFIKQAILVEHEEMAFIYQRIAEMLHSYHKDVNPIRDIIPVRKLAVGYTADQAIISALPLDYLHWTEITDLFTSELVLLSKSEDLPVKRMNMWISGECTSSARKALTAKGITLKENM